MESQFFDEARIQELVRKKEIDARKKVAIDIVTWGTKYIQSLLLDYNISIRRDYKGTKVKVVIDVECAQEDLDDEIRGFEKKPQVATI